MNSDVIILGGGLVGATLGVGLAAHGLNAIIIDPADPAVTLAPGFDGRASAVASASGRMLDAIGIGARLAGKGCAIRHIRVSDGLEPGALDFIPDADDGALGTMFENKLLRTAIHEAAVVADGVDLRMKTRATHVERGPAGVTVTLDTGDVIRAPLLVAAEGRNSPTRKAAGITVARWKYDHAAIIGAFHHERAHENIAFEIFYPTGPFALLPLPDDEIGHRSAIVWSVKGADGPAMLKLSDRAFLAEAEKQMGGFLGKLSHASPRASYPLGFHHAARVTAERLVLVGDAAHGIHPIAGQGLNLGFRDVAALVEVLVEGKRTGLDLGDAALLARYQQWRGLDTMMVAVATDVLNRLFGVPGRTASAVRRFGISAVNRIPPLKGRFMAEARGESGELPKLLQGVLV
ncbi:UbiH/UbiF/VisC/COQ6 family ubiquinone biosynthesis hydroxylase [Sphingomonas carotinifaciens]|uniref:2-octaprenyl-6-methoxyphenol hydroxylase n=1 Tax=Sphingomonas carotinifaciens TaxID=1166323 RepID=A0A1G7GUK4_9SPHN|nr:UbiH/UbiF/VisC/COQ6 family ubiquinone biosynthesis hydroxylase [Sphingomonas carotinifaciens]MBB4086666.1 2-octaprenyl-6-methoxyphenol hydroxylase [Sphingomonas carotinifaciens]MWC43015.1 ubiquinone biosynthesis protein UbiH [Sphingomonas carotinifaciens]SDE91639.1 2-octaprenyl-6-methoxyphenol hydroxylase [Sphingomonas carotinifaciens]